LIPTQSNKKIGIDQLHLKVVILILR